MNSIERTGSTAKNNILLIGGRVSPEHALRHLEGLHPFRGAGITMEYVDADTVRPGGPCMREATDDLPLRIARAAVRYHENVWGAGDAVVATDLNDRLESSYLAHPPILLRQNTPAGSTLRVLVGAENTHYRATHPDDKDDEHTLRVDGMRRPMAAVIIDAPAADIFADPDLQMDRKDVVQVPYGVDFPHGGSGLTREAERAVRTFRYCLRLDIRTR